MHESDIVKAFRVSKGHKFQLADHDPGETLGLGIDKGEAKDMLERDIQRLNGLQERLYAEARWAVLIVLQAMDAAGKDSAIEHVMSGLNPQGCEVTSFKAPSSLELRHDYLWRAALRLPERGRIGIFNRSHYEEVLVARVHPEILAGQQLPKALVTDAIWEERFEDIRAFEQHLVRNGTVVLKFFLNVSRDEQRRRFLDRIDDPGKRWKFNPDDIAERGLWDSYMHAYQDMIRNTATKQAPWYVVPADDKSFARLVIAAALVEQLERLDPQFPTLGGDDLKAMHEARKMLTDESP